jgi:hypothetical protein
MLDDIYLDDPLPTKISEYGPKRVMECLDTSAARFSTGQQSGHNAKLAPDLFLTFDPDGIPHANKKKDDAKTSTKRNKNDDDYQPTSPSVEGKSPERRLEHEIKTSIWNRPGITIEMKNNDTHEIKPSSQQSIRPDFESMTQQTQVLVRQALGYIVHGQWPALPYRFV